jgi:hypothetical protein
VRALRDDDGASLLDPLHHERRLPGSQPHDLHGKGLLPLHVIENRRSS